MTGIILMSALILSALWVGNAFRKAPLDPIEEQKKRDYFANLDITETFYHDNDKEASA